MKLKLPFLLLLALISSCINEWDKELEKVKLKHTLINKHKNINKNEIEINIYQHPNKLEINFNLGPFKNFSTNTLFFDWYIRFFYNKRFITFPIYFNTKFYNNENYKGKGQTIQFLVSANKKLTEQTTCTIEIPLYLFHEIKRGKQVIVAELFAKYKAHPDSSYMNEFYSDAIDISRKKRLENHDSVYTNNPSPNLSFRWLFEIDMPPIKRTQIVMKEIILQDDKNFSPRGMDFSFRDGLPDIYWTISYPVETFDDIKNLYWKSREAKYAYNYQYIDTIEILHLSKKDKLIFGVYDRDDFSRDDFIGDWYGHLLTLYSDTFKSLSFDYITSFKIKAKYKGCINCL